MFLTSETQLDHEPYTSLSSSHQFLNPDGFDSQSSNIASESAYFTEAQNSNPSDPGLTAAFNNYSLSFPFNENSTFDSSYFNGNSGHVPANWMMYVR